MTLAQEVLKLVNEDDTEKAEVIEVGRDSVSIMYKTGPFKGKKKHGVPLMTHIIPQVGDEVVVSFEQVKDPRFGAEFRGNPRVTKVLV